MLADPNIFRVSSFILNETAVRDIGWEDPIGKWFETSTLDPATDNWMSVRIASEDIPETMAFLEKEYTKLNSDYPFYYSFYDEDIAALYDGERKFLRLFFIFSPLAIIIASLGILGLASYSVEQRTREIGIRKVAGSTVNQIILLITNEFFNLVLIAILMAWPVGSVYCADYSYLSGMACCYQKPHRSSQIRINLIP